MGNGQWGIGNGQWAMGNREWAMGSKCWVSVPQPNLHNLIVWA
ncbi:MAG: hypothetical protein SAL70_32350 [Scytonema sp. PMC 1070.18]|nr:hypothetical protein [Scytonema sp. PMC 1070.18]